MSAKADRGLSLLINQKLWKLESRELDPLHYTIEDRVISCEARWVGSRPPTIPQRPGHSGTLSAVRPRAAERSGPTVYPGEPPNAAHILDGLYVTGVNRSNLRCGQG
jgi:hypothetical protein